MQAQTPYKTEEKNTKLVHISFENRICRHRSHVSQKRRIQNLCTYLLGIEYASTLEEVEIEIKTKVTPRQVPH